FFISAEDRELVAPRQRRDVVHGMRLEGGIAGKARHIGAVVPEVIAGGELIAQLLIEPEQIAVIEAEAPTVAAENGNAAIVVRAVDAEGKAILGLEHEVGAAGRRAFLGDEIDLAERVLIEPDEILA